MSTDLQSHETELRGEWVVAGNQVTGNAICERIAWLIQSRLNRVASANHGWDTLFRDPHTDRFWELTYPHSEWHGGGPPMLRAISLSDAQAKYFRSSDI